MTATGSATEVCDQSAINRAVVPVSPTCGQGPKLNWKWNGTLGQWKYKVAVFN